MERKLIILSFVIYKLFLVSDGSIPLECKLTPGGHEYLGTKRVTRSNRTCQRWDSESPHRPSAEYTDPNNFPDYNLTMAENFCRNPDRGWHQSPWCYTIVHSTRWENCDIPFCECKTDRQGSLYQGKQTTTTSGRTCQSWRSQSPHAHNFTRSQMFPDRLFSDISNRCRNPDNFRPDGPWCFTTDQNVRWEYCDIPNCCELRQDCPTTTAPLVTELVTTEIETTTIITTETTSPTTVSSKPSTASDLARELTTEEPEVTLEVTTPEVTTQEVTSTLQPSSMTTAQAHSTGTERTATTKTSTSSTTETGRKTDRPDILNTPAIKDPKTGKRKSRTVKIAVGVVVGVAALVAIAGAIFWWGRRHYLSHNRTTKAKPDGRASFDNAAFRRTSST